MLLGRIVQHGGSDLPEVDTAALENMTVMGFDHDRSHYALLCTQNDVGAAIHWLQEHAFESLAQLRSHAQQEARGNDAMGVLPARGQAMTFCASSVYSLSVNVLAAGISHTEVQ